MGVAEDRKLLGISRTLNIFYMDATAAIPGPGKKQDVELAVRESIENHKTCIFATDEDDKINTRSIQAGAFGETAKLVLKLYREGRGEASKLNGCEFTPQPNESGADEGMALKIVSILKTCDMLTRSKRVEGSAKNLREEAEQKAKDELLGAVKAVLLCWFTVNGIDISGKKEITREQMTAAAKAFPGRLKEYQRMVVDYDRMVMQLLAEKVKETEGYRKAFEDAAEKSRGALKERMSRCMDYLRAAVKCDGGGIAISKVLVEKIASDIKISMKKEDEYVCSRNLLLANPGFKGLEDAVREYFRIALNFVAFVAECAEQFLEFTVDKKEPDFLHGNYIRAVWGAECNRVEPLKPIEAQIELIDDRLAGLPLGELQRYPVTYLIQSALGKKRESGKSEGVSLAALKKRCGSLMKKRDAHPELFVEPGAIRLFKHIPEMMRLFEEAKELRRDMRAFADEEAGALDENGLKEFRDIYTLCCAFYDTLLTRHIKVVSSSRLTLPEIIDAKQTLQTASFDYCLKRCSDKMVSGGEYYG